MSITKDAIRFALANLKKFKEFRTTEEQLKQELRRNQFVNMVSYRSEEEIRKSHEQYLNQVGATKEDIIIKEMKKARLPYKTQYQLHFWTDLGYKVYMLHTGVIV